MKTQIIYEVGDANMTVNKYFNLNGLNENRVVTPKSRRKRK